MTTLVPSASRQRIRGALQKILFSDLVSGTAKNIFTPFKNGTVFLSGQLIVKTPFNSATSDVMTIGKTVDDSAVSANAYLTSTSIATAANTRTPFTVIPPFVEDVATGARQLTATWTGVSTAPTAGEVWVAVQYMRDGHEDFSEG